jgi:hypothetical protein
MAWRLDAMAAVPAPGVSQTPTIVSELDADTDVR